MTNSPSKILNNNKILNDPICLMIVFIFIVLIFICISYFRVLNDIKENIHIIKALLLQK